MESLGLFLLGFACGIPSTLAILFMQGKLPPQNNTTSVTIPPPTKRGSPKRAKS